MPPYDLVFQYRVSCTRPEQYIYNGTYERKKSTTRDDKRRAHWGGLLYYINLGENSKDLGLHSTPIKNSHNSTTCLSNLIDKQVAIMWILLVACAICSVLISYINVYQQP